VEIDRRFRGTYCLERFDIGGSTCEMWVNFYQTTQRSIQQTVTLFLLVYSQSSFIIVFVSLTEWQILGLYKDDLSIPYVTYRRMGCGHVHK
jgi:hypothetical protein